MFPSQSNILSGSRKFNSGEALTDMEGRLVKLVDGGSIPELLLPEAVSDICLFVVGDGNGLDEESEVIPLEVGKEIRIRTNGVVAAGAVLVLDAIAGANIGKVVTIPAVAGIYFSPGIAAEDAVDEQLIKVNPLPRIIVVADSVAAPAAATSTNGGMTAQAPAALTSTDGVAAAAAADLAALAAEAEKIGDDVRSLHAKYTLAITEAEKVSDDARAALAAVADLRLKLITAGAIVAP